MVCHLRTRPPLATGSASLLAPILFCKACESASLFIITPYLCYMGPVFIAEITARAFIIADSNKRRTLSRADIAKALTKSDQFDFLIDIVPREEPFAGAGANPSGSGPKRQPLPTAAKREPVSGFLSKDFFGLAFLVIGRDINDRPGPVLFWWFGKRAGQGDSRSTEPASIHPSIHPFKPRSCAHLSFSQQISSPTELEPKSHAEDEDAPQEGAGSEVLDQVRVRAACLSTPPSFIIPNLN